MHLELMSYEQYPEDEYTTAVANIRIDGKYIVAYCQKKTKEGGQFWAPASISVKKGGAKTFVQGFMLDSRFEEKRLIDFVSTASKNQGALSPNSVFSSSEAKQTASTSIPYGNPPPNFSDGGYVEQNLPF